MADKVQLSKRKCIPCEGNVLPLSEVQAEELNRELNDWTLIDGAALLAKSFRFPDFDATMEFVNKVAAIAKEQGHHPDMNVSYGGVTIELMTHAIGGLSENDFILAAKIDEIA